MYFVEIADFQLRKLIHYLINRVNHLQEEIGRISEDNEQLLLDNQRKISEKRRAEELITSVETQNEELRILLAARGVTRELVEKLIGERNSREAEDLNKTLKQVRELKTHIKWLEREHKLALETSFFHKEPTDSLTDCSQSQTERPE